MRSSPSAVFDAAAVGVARKRRKRKRSAARHRLEHVLFRLATSVLGLLPSGFASSLGPRAARAFLVLESRRRRILLANLAHALPEKGPGELRTIARESVESFGAALLEFLGVLRLTREELLARVRLDGLEHLMAARSAGRGVFLLSAHFGSWELGALVTGLSGEPIASVVRPLDNPLLERELALRRTRFGNRLIPKKEAAREILRAMRRNETVAILVDQNVQPQEAVFVPFFGRLAATTPALALMQLKTGAAVVPVFTYPLGEGLYRLRFEAPIFPEEFASVEGRSERVRRATARYMEVTEAAIRRCPSAWLWMHDRWKTRPG